MFDFLKTSEKGEAISGKKNTKFEVTLKEVKSLSTRAKEHMRVEKVAEKGGFLKLRSHKVTGRELNVATDYIDDSIMQVKNVQSETLQHILQLYQTLDALDEEHVAGILSAIKAAEAATDLARINDKTIGKIANYLMQDELVLAHKEEQRQKIEALEKRIKSTCFMTCCALVVASVSLVICLLLLL